MLPGSCQVWNVLRWVNNKKIIRVLLRILLVHGIMPSCYPLAQKQVFKKAGVKKTEALTAITAGEEELSAVYRRKAVVVVGGDPPEALRKQLAELMAASHTAYAPRKVLYESDECVVNSGNASLGCLCALLARSSAD